MMKQCPFCNNPIEIFNHGNLWNFNHNYVFCPLYHHAKTDYINWTSKEELIKVLNARPIEDALRQRVADLETILRQSAERVDIQYVGVNTSCKLADRIEELEGENLVLFAELEKWRSPPSPNYTVPESDVYPESANIK